MKAFWLLGFGLVVCAQAQAGQVLSASVEQRDSQFHVEVDMRVEAPVEVVRKLVTDYPKLELLMPAISASKLMAHLGTREDRVQTRLQACVAFYCRAAVQVQDVQVLPDGNITATMRSEGSDFVSGTARWKFWPDPQGTRLRYISDVEPKFWVPPLVTPWLARRTLRQQAAECMKNLERMAEESYVGLR